MDKEELEHIINRTIIKEAKSGEYRLYTVWTSVDTLVSRYVGYYSIFANRTFSQWYSSQKKHWELHKDDPTDIDILIGNLETMYESGMPLKDCNLIDHYVTDMFMQRY